MGEFLIGHPPCQRERACELDLGGGGRPEQQVGGGGLADEQRVNPAPRFVEQPLFEQSVGQLAEPVLDDVLAGLLLQAADRGDRVATDYWVLFHFGSRSVLDTTDLVMLLIWSLVGSPDRAIYAAAKTGLVGAPAHQHGVAGEEPVGLHLEAGDRMTHSFGPTTWAQRRTR